jgi:ABC-type polysaccharide/polyol phosphate transport system ATPase subunit
MRSDASRLGPAIRAVGLSKTYRLGERRRLGAGLTSRLRGMPLERPTLRALRGVTLDIAEGECFGIVGGNGSGKSTLLQILSRSVVPTKGWARVRGTVLPMLSVGAGFHGDLTGRENVVLQGSILGLRRQAVLERIGDILEFAELGRHADTPLKRYSRGMQSRLAFAIGMRLPADIYIFDEVLELVDGAFRQRCLDEIERMIGSGPTILVVSHDLDQIARLCGRTVWLNQGAVRAVGPTEMILPQYRTHLGAYPTVAVADLRQR